MNEHEHEHEYEHEHEGRAVPGARVFGRRQRRLSRGARAALWIAAVLLVLVAAAGAFIALPLPADIVRPAPVPGLVLEDRRGIALRVARAPGGERGGWIALAEIDPTVPRAFLAAEDRRFFEHHGVDLRAVFRAMLVDVAARRVVSGASTLTMQTARLFRPTRRGFPGKVQQTLWALRLEAHLDKRAILERYLNRVPLGQGTVGVAGASELYLGGPPRQLSLAQAALLASLARAPSRDNPLVSPRRAKRRRDAVIRRMAATGYATAEDARRARGEPVTVPQPSTPFLAPHFTTEVLERAQEAGLAPVGRLRTTLDLELQREVEGEVRHTVDLLRERGAGQAAAVVLDNASGDILAWVGSPDFWQAGVGQVDMVSSPRQPGSALKPFLYALAFDRGFTAATVLPDVPKNYATPAGSYTPRNYDRRYHGPVRVRDALGSSYNVPAVEMADRLGVPALLRTLRAAGFASLTGTPEHYGLGLALGNGDVTLLELANAYRGLARGGVWAPVRWSGTTAEGASGGAGEWGSASSGLDANADSAAASGGAREPGRFVSARAAVLVLDILADPAARIPGFGVETPFDLPFPAAGKTGTSRHFTDNGAVVTTGGYTVAVWVGNSSGQPMEGVSGISGAGPLLYRTALRVAARYPTGALPSPAEAGLKQLAVCRLSGLRAAGDCPSIPEWFVPGTEPRDSGDWRDAEGQVQWPAEYAEWLAQEPALAASAAPATAEKAAPAGGGVVAREPFRIVSIQDGDRYAVPPGVDPRYATLPLRAAGGSAASGVRWYVDGKEVRTQRWPLVKGKHRIRAVSAKGERAEVTVTVE